MEESVRKQIHRKLQELALSHGGLLPNPGYIAKLLGFRVQLVKYHLDVLEESRILDRPYGSERGRPYRLLKCPDGTPFKVGIIDDIEETSAGSLFFVEASAEQALKMGIDRGILLLLFDKNGKYGEKCVVPLVVPLATGYSEWIRSFDVSIFDMKLRERYPNVRSLLRGKFLLFARLSWERGVPLDLLTKKAKRIGSIDSFTYKDFLENTKNIEDLPDTSKRKQRYDDFLSRIFARGERFVPVPSTFANKDRKEGRVSIGSIDFKATAIKRPDYSELMIEWKYTEKPKGKGVHLMLYSKNGSEILWEGMFRHGGNRKVSIKNNDEDFKGPEDFSFIGDEFSIDWEHYPKQESDQ